MLITFAGPTASKDPIHRQFHEYPAETGERLAILTNIAKDSLYLLMIVPKMEDPKVRQAISVGKVKPSVGEHPGKIVTKLARDLHIAVNNVDFPEQALFPKFGQVVTILIG